MHSVLGNMANHRKHAFKQVHMNLVLRLILIMNENEDENDVIFARDFRFVKISICLLIVVREQKWLCAKTRH